MTGRWIGLLGVWGLVLGLVRAQPVFPDAPPVAHTGGFGEPTCRDCHFENPLNAPGGALTLDGLPDGLTPGASYRLVINLARPGLQRGGVQLTARFTDGAQAGTFVLPDTGLAAVRDDASGVVYVQHTEDGTSPISPDTARWLLTWIAPDTAAAVVFHAAANAANGDDSEFGDFVYATEVASRTR